MNFKSNKTISACLFFFLFIIESYFLNPTIIAQIFKRNAKLAIHIEIPSKEAKAEI